MKFFDERNEFYLHRDKLSNKFCCCSLQVYLVTYQLTLTQRIEQNWYELLIKERYESCLFFMLIHLRFTNIIILKFGHICLASPNSYYRTTYTCRLTV